VLLVDKHFITLLADSDPRVIKAFGDTVEGKRYYVINEASVQAIGGGDLV
jgi:hypothetical protein